jgi:sRNA-binding carbon storage regulator CsrA
MLVLPRRLGESIVISDTLFLTLVAILPSAVELAVFDSLVRVHSTICVDEGNATSVAPHTRVIFCGVGQTGSIRIGIDTPSGLSILRKELWDILPGHGRPG